MRSRLIIIFFSLSISYCADSQDKLMYQLPGMAKVIVKEDIPYTTPGDTALTFDIYYPAGYNTQNRLPLVIFNNGIGIMEMPEWGQYKEWCRLIAASGMIAIIYQARPRKGLTDGEAIIDYMVDHAGELGIDPGRIGLWTCSGNGPVGARLAFKTRPEIIKAFVMYYGMTDSLGSLRQNLPTFVVRAGLDAQNLNVNIDNFVQSCLTADIRLQFINFLNGIHAFDIFTNTEECREIIKSTVEFLKKNLQGPAIPNEFVLTNRNFMWLILHDQISFALAEFRKARTKYRADSTFQPFFTGVIKEDILNTNGYWLLQHERVPDALEVFKLAVESYPSSPNAYESLSEAQEISGNKEEALLNARMTLEKLGASEMDIKQKENLKASAEKRINRLK